MEELKIFGYPYINHKNLLDLSFIDIDGLVYDVKLKKRHSLNKLEKEYNDYNEKHRDEFGEETTFAEYLCIKGLVSKVVQNIIHLQHD